MKMIYLVKMTNRAEKETCVKLNLNCEHWNGQIIRCYKNRKEATDFARMSNRVSKKSDTTHYFTVEKMILH